MGYEGKYIQVNEAVRKIIQDLRDECRVRAENNRRVFMDQRDGIMKVVEKLRRNRFDAFLLDNGGQEVAATLAIILQRLQTIA